MSDVSRPAKPRVCTVWYAKNPDSAKWEYNHFSFGYSPAVRQPAPINDTQKAAWKKKPWASFRAELANGVLRERPESISYGPICWTGSAS